VNSTFGISEVARILVFTHRTSGLFSTKIVDGCDAPTTPTALGLGAGK
jgi:hypothetical protein